MNSKILVGAGASATAVIVMIAMAFMFGGIAQVSQEDKDEPQISHQNQWEGIWSFSSDGIGTYQRLCSENNGVWFGPSECRFEHNVDHNKFNAQLDYLRDQVHPITGEYAAAICHLADISCGEELQFDGRQDLDDGKIYYNFISKNKEYNFRIIDGQLHWKGQDKVDGDWVPREPSWRIFDFEEQDMTEYLSARDGAGIDVSTQYLSYASGDDIIIEGKVLEGNSDNHLADYYPNDVAIKIARQGQLVEIAQVKVQDDGSFSHVVNAEGNLWQSGNHEVRAFYEDNTATSKFKFMRMDSHSIKHGAEIKIDNNLLVLGDTFTLSGTSHNQKNSYVIVEIYYENKVLVDKIRLDVDQNGFFSKDFETKSDWGVGQYSAKAYNPAFRNVVYFDVLGTAETWEQVSKEIQNFT